MAAPTMGQYAGGVPLQYAPSFSALGASFMDYHQPFAQQAPGYMPPQLGPPLLPAPQPTFVPYGNQYTPYTTPGPYAYAMPYAPSNAPYNVSSGFLPPSLPVPPALAQPPPALPPIRTVQPPPGLQPIVPYPNTPSSVGGSAASPNSAASVSPGARRQRGAGLGGQHSSLQFTEAGLSPAFSSSPTGRKMFGCGANSSQIVAHPSAFTPAEGVPTTEHTGRRIHYAQALKDHVVMGEVGLTVAGQQPSVGHNAGGSSGSSNSRFFPTPSPQVVATEYGLTRAYEDKARSYMFKEQAGRIRGSHLQSAPTGMTAAAPPAQYTPLRRQAGSEAYHGSHLSYGQAGMFPMGERNPPGGGGGDGGADERGRRVGPLLPGARLSSIQHTAGGITVPDSAPVRGVAKGNGNWVTTHDSMYTGT